MLLNSYDLWLEIMQQPRLKLVQLHFRTCDCGCSAVYVQMEMCKKLLPSET